MRFKVDENLPVELADVPRAAGHEADTVEGEGLTGSPDSDLLARVRMEGRAILTMDKGIADIRSYPPADYGGIILLRPQTLGRRAILAFVQRHLAALLQFELKGKLLVVSDVGIRSR
jgi:predicted nuclease of predicted toxin-antitoxin system